MVPHIYVHGGSHDDGSSAGQIERGQEIVGDAAREFCEDVGGGWSDQQEVGALRYRDVFDGALEISFASGFGEEIGEYFLAGESGERQRSDKFAGAAGHCDLDGESVLLEAAD